MTSGAACQAVARVDGPPNEDLRLVDMTLSNLDAVLAIEVTVYSFPWTRANFVDSLAAGHLARVLLDAQDIVVGYYIALPAPDEMHLLNITVMSACQRRGYSQRMFEDLLQKCRELNAAKVWLEVRPSNQPARALYERLGFTQLGQRKAYYPAGVGRREDALVLCLAVAAPPEGGPHALD
jgi:[ribosomal protein S18]-alanine N-acetyltransferase